MKTLAVPVIVITLGLMGFVKAQDKKVPQALIKETGLRVVLIDGNRLYAWCSVAEKSVTLNGGDNASVSGSREDGVAVGSCWAYIEGVIDSTPVGDEINPGPDVRVSQEVDVVTAYLKSHANIRDQPASVLVQKAMRDAFPHQ
jgi:hypothetical protein